jgi:hypothetical protein
MKNIDHWFILIGLLYGIFGCAFGICVGINESIEQAHLHAYINLMPASRSPRRTRRWRSPPVDRCSCSSRCWCSSQTIS